MIDIHTHLHFSDYDSDREEVIRRAREVGVKKMILVGTDVESSRSAVKLAEQYEFLYASVGVHPHSFDKIEREFPISSSQFSNNFQFENSKFKDELNEIRSLAKHPKVVAIGECGLDYFSRGQQPTIGSQQKSVQMGGFLAQVDVAREAGLPLIIHTRPSAGTSDAYEDTLSVLADPKIVNHDLKCILHCYQGNAEVTKKFIELPNLFFSFTGSVTYPVKKSLVGTKDDPQEVIRLIPSERIFIETDCPYLSPQEKRGERNEPAFSMLTARYVAALKGEDVLSGIDDRAARIFGF